MKDTLRLALSKISKLKRKELILPIAKKEVVVSPLSVGDDMILKTALISPVKLDKELMKLLWQHTEFWIPSPDAPVLAAEPTTEVVDGISGVPTGKKSSAKKKKSSAAEAAVDRTGGSYKQLTEGEFYKNISYFDKLMLLWGIYQTTYVTLGKREISCPECGQHYQVEVEVEETLHDDSLHLFEEDVPFGAFTQKILIPHGTTHTLEFTVGIPSMADFNRVLGLVSTQELQYNLENIRSQFNSEQLMTLYTKKLAVYPNDSPEDRSEATYTNEILSSIRDFVTIDAVSEFFGKYSDLFSKYNINFYKEAECPACKHKAQLGVDIEYEFFRKQLPN